MARILSAACVLVALSCKGDGPRPETPPAAEAAPEAPAAQTAPAADDAPAVVFSPEGAQPARVLLEVVDTPRAIQRGLMYRKHLPPDRGMLFIFPDERPRSFWMKNTLIPLDMIFVRDDLTVTNVVERAEPLTLDSRRSTEPARYVIEVNGGWAAAHGVGAGTSLRFENVP